MDLAEMGFTDIITRHYTQTNPLPFDLSNAWTSSRKPKCRVEALSNRFRFWCVQIPISHVYIAKTDRTSMLRRVGRQSRRKIGIVDPSVT